MGCGAEPNPLPAAPGLGCSSCSQGTLGRVAEDASKGSSSSPLTALGSSWSPVGPEHLRAGLAGAGPGITRPVLPGNATTSALRPQNMTLGSIIYTVFASDSDTGNASKVSYSIEEVSTVNCRAGHTPHPALSCTHGAEGAGGSGQGQPHGSGGGVLGQEERLCTHWAMGARSKLGMSQVVRGPHSP